MQPLLCLLLFPLGMKEASIANTVFDDYTCSIIKNWYFLIPCSSLTCWSKPKKLVLFYALLIADLLEQGWCQIWCLWHNTSGAEAFWQDGLLVAKDTQYLYIPLHRIAEKC